MEERDGDCKSTGCCSSKSVMKGRKRQGLHPKRKVGWYWDRAADGNRWAYGGGQETVAKGLRNRETRGGWGYALITFITI